MRFLILVLFLHFTWSCTTKSGATPAAEEQDPSERIQVLNDTIMIGNRIRDFIIWYRDHYKEVNDVKFVSPDEQGNYQVNPEECNKYLSRLNSSGFISKSYLEAWSKYFESKEKDFKQFPQSEGPPEGFEFDLVFITQEPELVWNQVQLLKLEISMTEEGKAIATTNELGYDFEMSMEDGQWKIDYISTMNYD